MKEKATYNIEEVAIALRVSLKTVYRMLRRNEIQHTHLNPSHRTVRIPAQEFSRLIAGRDKVSGSVR